MKLIRVLLISSLLGSMSAAMPAHASHDNGQGKSQDGGQIGSTAVAPEPESYLLFLSGLIVLYAWHRASARHPRS